MKRIINNIIFELAKLPMSGYFRGKLISHTGVKMIKGERENLEIFIGENVVIDHLYPKNISIGNKTTIATGCILLTHFLDSSTPIPGFKFKKGNIKIGFSCFIGANSILCNDVTIGDNAIVGAGSVVTKDIPANEIWAGNPAKFIKKRNFIKSEEVNQ